MSSTEERETEWLQRVGTPAGFEMNQDGTPLGADMIRDAVKTMSSGGDYTVVYFDPEQLGNHCRLMMSTQGCSLFVAPAVIRNSVPLLGSDNVTITVDADDARGRTTLGTLLFWSPPNRDAIERFRQIERATERRMVALHKIRFPEDAAPKAELATR
jgi:hypothetical protein